MEAERSQARGLHDLDGEDHRRVGQDVQLRAEGPVLGRELRDRFAAPPVAGVTEDAQSAPRGLLRQGVGAAAVRRHCKGIDVEKVWSTCRLGRENGVHLEITTLGRGGSDVTAVALASALGAESCEIYTDVPGVFTADPRIVPEARQLSRLSYDEMLEMASSGAVVLQTRSVEYAKFARVRLHVRSTWSDAPGTVVEEAPEMERIRLVTGVTHDLDVARLTIRDLPDVPGIAHRIFSALAARHINVDMIVQTASRGERADISFTVTRSEAGAAEETMREVGREIGGGEVSAAEDVAKVSIVGAGMASSPGVASAMFGALAEAGVNIQMISTSEIKVSCVISAADTAKAVRAVHRAFNLDALR